MLETFVYELPLKTTPETEHTLNIRFDAGGNIYNGSLDECINRLSLMKQSQEWQKASSLPRSKERSRLFKEAQKKYKFSEYELHAYVKTIMHNCWVGDHIDAQIAQVIATRAFKATDRYRLKKNGKPRFKKKYQFASIEGKSNKTGIRFKNGKIIWNKLVLEPVYDLVDKHGVETHALQATTKYVRLIRRRVKDKVRFFVQLILEGKPLIKEKNKVAQGKEVGMDIGPSTIAIVADNQAILDLFCKELETIDREIKYSRRAIDRSRRATNPDNYSENGVPLKGRLWKISKRCKKKQNTLNEELRRQAATRKTSHGTLCNKILSLGTTIKTEKLSYKSFQKNFGRSIIRSAPGSFMEILRRKAANAGGQVIEFSTNKTKLSQSCHACEKVKKKPLRQRWHNCDCGIQPMQRDLYSAFLVKHVQEERLDRSQAADAWSSAVPLLQQALSKCEQTAKGKQRFFCFGFAQRQSGSSV